MFIAFSLSNFQITYDGESLEPMVGVSYRHRKPLLDAESPCESMKILTSPTKRVINVFSVSRS